MRLPYLWSFRRCPYAIRARYTLDYAQIDYEIREIKLRDKPVHMLKDSPKGTVPVLVCDDGRVLDESLDIMRWALSVQDTEHWLAQSDAEAVHIDHWLHANDRFKPLLDAYKYADRYPEKTREAHWLSALEHLNAMNERLAEQAYLVAERVTLADVALFPFVRQCYFVNQAAFKTHGLSALEAWLNAFLDSAHFEQVMRKHPLWQP